MPRTGPVAADEVWPETGSLLTQFFKLEEGPNHDLPILKAMAERLPFLDQHASVRSRPQERYVLSGFPIFDSQGTLVGYRCKAAAIAARAPRDAQHDRKSDVKGTSVSAGVDCGVRRLINK